MKHKEQVKKLHEMDVASLESDLKEALKEHFNLRVQLTTGQLNNNTAKLRSVRKNIARINTFIIQKKKEIKKN